MATSGVTSLPLPAYIDHLATCDPDQPFAEIDIREDGDCRRISVKQLAVAINKAAWWLDERLRHLYLSRTFAYVSSDSDLRYFILMVAACKTGRLAFFSSPRNDLETHCSLFEKYACKTLLLPQGGDMRNQLQSVIEAESLACIEVPELDFFFAFTPDPYVWHYSDRTIATEPLVYLHSSGSTGLPRPVKIKHGNMIAQEKWKQVPEFGYSPVHFCQWGGRRVLLTLPLFHLVGLCTIVAALQNGFTLLLPAVSSKPANAKMVVDIIRSTKVDVLVAGPSTLSDIAAERKQLDALSQISCAAFGGGPLPENAGEAIRRRTSILNLIGMTEAGILPCGVPDDKDWQYFQFSPILGLELRHSADGLYDLVFVRSESAKEYQVPFYTFPERTEYETGDLFSRHPSVPGLWKWAGRNDDMVVYSSGEKYDPTAMEMAIRAHPLISAALVCGTGKFNSALLVEPAEPEACSSPGKFIDEIWPHIRKANSNSPAHVRVMRDMIMVTKPGAPLPRAGKGAIQRTAALDLYHKELDALSEGPTGRKDSKASAFSAFSLCSAPSYSPPLMSPPASPLEIDVEVSQRPREEPFLAQGPTPASPTEGALRDSDPVQRRWGDCEAPLLAERICEILKEHCSVSVSITADIFAAGVDSLGVTMLVRELQRLQPEQQRLERYIFPEDVYQHSTPAALASYLCHGQGEGTKVEDQMQALFDKYASDLPLTARKPLMSNGAAKVVVLTGSTGSLGTYLLDRLIHDEGVAEIICLNRRANAAQIQARVLIRRGLCADFDKKPITFAVSDFSRPHLGLQADDYKDFLQRTTHVIHTAWNVNFNLPLSQFEKPHIQGVRQLIEFSARSRYGAAICFISSIGAVRGYRQARTTNGGVPSIPEISITDWAAAAHENGYGQSKLVSERLLYAATAQAGVPSTVIRMGQLAGPSPGDGEWQKNEWLPTLVVSSRNMGCLPSSLGSFNNVDWVPIDLAARIIVEMLPRPTDSRGPEEPLVYHVVNPQPTAWQTLLPAVQTALAVNKTVSLADWVELLRGLEGQDIDQYPAVKLIPFYETLLANDKQEPQYLTLDTVQSQKSSDTLSKLTPVTGEMFRGWIRRWF